MHHFDLDNKAMTLILFLKTFHNFEDSNIKLFELPCCKIEYYYFSQNLIRYLFAKAHINKHLSARFKAIILKKSIVHFLNVKLFSVLK